MSHAPPPAEIEDPRTTYRRLVSAIRTLEGVVVAFSGGVDSSLLLAAAHDALGPRALAVTALSPTYPAHEFERAVALAGRIGARHLLLESREMEDARFTANPPDRCYYCKRELFGLLRTVAAREGLPVILDGTHHDDRLDLRPGRRAAQELQVRSPLAELGLDKNTLRRMARERGLPNWNAPPAACLASRIPYGQTITPARLRRVDAAEQAIRALGCSLVRVRDHGDLARVELDPEALDRTLHLENRRRLVEACRRQGYTFVCLDLEGYRTGSMNEALAR
ncbi:MAG: ATP-dependent sacrificial sulfur transferase LarE [Myxococcales bacterium]|nr:ATP-dependent sacrificial sulfur transferase LarE [Myxococcales bacterium]